MTTPAGTTPVINMPRPGCFGSPTCHHATQLPCAQCPFQASCGPVAERVGQGLRLKYGINVLLENNGRHVGRPPGGVKVSAEEMPVKVREHLTRFQTRGIDLKRAAQMGVNPFTGSTPGFMRVAMDRLLKGAFTRDELRAAFTAELGWSDGTALSHVSIATSILFNAGAATDHGGGVIGPPLTHAVAA